MPRFPSAYAIVDPGSAARWRRGPNRQSADSHGTRVQRLSENTANRRGNDAADIDLRCGQILGSIPAEMRLLPSARRCALAPMEMEPNVLCETVRLVAEVFQSRVCRQSQRSFLSAGNASTDESFARGCVLRSEDDLIQKILAAGGWYPNAIGKRSSEGCLPAAIWYLPTLQSFIEPSARCFARRGLMLPADLPSMYPLSSVAAR